MREQGEVDRNANDGDRAEMPRSPSKKEAMKRGGNHSKFFRNSSTILLPSAFLTKLIGKIDLTCNPGFNFSAFFSLVILTFSDHLSQKQRAMEFFENLDRNLAKKRSQRR